MISDVDALCVLAVLLLRYFWRFMRTFLYTASCHNLLPLYYRYAPPRQMTSPRFSIDAHASRTTPNARQSALKRRLAAHYAFRCCFAHIADILSARISRDDELPSISAHFHLT